MIETKQITIAFLIGLFIGGLFPIAIQSASTPTIYPIPTK